MNSSGNSRFETLIDEMLTSSVSRGSEPEGFKVRFMPRRPIFPWLKLVYVLSGAVVLSCFMAHWFSSWNFENTDFQSMFSLERLWSMLSGVSSGGLVSALAIVLGLIGAILTFLPEKPGITQRLL